MNSKLLAFAVMLSVITAALFAPLVSAHVLIQDSTRKYGAVLHITPDDDPIAGQEAGLYFDIDAPVMNPADVYIEIIDASTNQAQKLETTVKDSTIQAAYTFPSRGVYDINLHLASMSDMNFSYTQRVSRGIGSPSTQPDYPIARAALIVGAVGMIFVIIVAFNRRKDIFSQSSF